MPRRRFSSCASCTALLAIANILASNSVSKRVCLVLYCSPSGQGGNIIPNRPYGVPDTPKILASRSALPPKSRKIIKNKSQGATPESRTLRQPKVARCNSTTSHPATLSHRTLRHLAITPCHFRLSHPATRKPRLGHDFFPADQVELHVRFGLPQPLEHFRRPCATVLFAHVRAVNEKDIRLFSVGGKWRHNRRERNERGDFGLLGLQVSSFGYEIYDVHMPHSIPLLKEGVKREKILRIMVFDGCERPVLPFLGISVGD